MVAPGVVLLGGAFYNLSGQRVCGAPRERRGRCRRVLSKTGRCVSHGDRGSARCLEDEAGVVTSHAPPRDPSGELFGDHLRILAQSRSGEDAGLWSGPFLQGQPYYQGPPVNPHSEGQELDSPGFRLEERRCGPEEAGYGVPRMIHVGRDDADPPLVPLRPLWHSSPTPPDSPSASDAYRPAEPRRQDTPSPRVCHLVEPSAAQESQDILSDQDAPSGARTRACIVLDSPQKVRSILREHRLAIKTSRAVWTEAEIRRLERGIRALGFGRWKQISAAYVPTKTPAQLQSRARVWKREMEALSRLSRPGDEAGPPASPVLLTGPLAGGTRADVPAPRSSQPFRLSTGPCKPVAETGEAEAAAAAAPEGSRPDAAAYKCAMYEAACNLRLERFEDAFP